MSKLVNAVVNSCIECPYWRNEIGFTGCILTGAKVNLRIESIHYNCPLPNAHEGAHCADTPKTE